MRNWAVPHLSSLQAGRSKEREQQAPSGAARLAPAPRDQCILVGAGERLLGLAATGKQGEKAPGPQEGENQGAKRRFPLLQVGFSAGEVASSICDQPLLAHLCVRSLRLRARGPKRLSRGDGDALVIWAPVLANRSQRSGHVGSRCWWHRFP